MSFDNDLQARMRVTRPGQVTWARPDLGQYCATCRHLGHVRKKRDETTVARCGMVRAITKKDGVEFKVDGAIACSKYEGGAA